MPFVLLFIGIIITLTAINNTWRQLGAQLKQDFTGPNNFFYWIVAVGVVGSLGYVPQLEKFSRVFIGLLLLVIILSSTKSGLWDKIRTGIAP